MTIAVTLAIDPASIEQDSSIAIVGTKLVEMGGPMVSWTPDLNGAPARAEFKFGTEAERERFIEWVLRVPGVSLAVPASGVIN